MFRLLSVEKQLLRSLQSRSFAKTLRRPPSVRPKASSKPAPETSLVSQNDPWVAVRDQASGLNYWWNQKTNVEMMQTNVYRMIVCLLVGNNRYW